MENNKNIVSNTNNDDAKIVGKLINKNDKVMVKIPADPLNPLDNVVPVQINGYKWIIKRNTTVYLPAMVVKVLEEAGYFN